MNKISKKILISGASGMLGKVLVEYLALNEEYKIYNISYSKHVISSSVFSLSYENLENHSFDAFFHCAAEVNVNLCENDFKHAVNSNSEYTRLLFLKVKASKYIYISTDSVYKGDVGNFNESAEISPLNNYAKSKLMGELEATKLTRNLYIIRTNIFGNNSKSQSSLYEWAKRELLLKNAINGFVNIYFNPLSVKHLAEILIQLINNYVPFGVYNLGSNELLSKYDFLIKVSNLLSANENLIIPTDYQFSEGIAKRPLNTTLDCTKIKKLIKNLDLSIDKSFALL